MYLQIFFHCTMSGEANSNNNSDVFSPPNNNVDNLYSNISFLSSLSNSNANNQNIPFLSSSPNDESNISFLSSSPNDSASNSKVGPKKKPVWQHFDTIGSKTDGHQGCKCKYCKWSQKKGKSSIMEAHLALKCLSVPKEIKNIFLHVINNRDDINIPSS